jgi:hypothetical protein
METKNRYPKLEKDLSIGRKYYQNESWRIEEKIDGSNLCFYVDSWECFSRRRKLPDNAGGNFGPFLGRSKRLETQEQKEIIQIRFNNFVFYGEAMKGQKSNLLCYERSPKGGVIWFDCYDTFWGEWVTDQCLLELLEEFAKATGTECISDVEIFKTFPSDRAIIEHLEKPSMLGGKREGIVIKPQNPKLNLTFRSHAFKVVNEEFQEKFGKDRRKKYKGNKFEELVETFCTPARIHKQIIILKDDGQWKSPSQLNIGPLIKSVANDILIEEKEQIETALLKIFKKSLGSTCGKIISNVIQEVE